ncbi:MAG: penicillin-binding protein 2 [Anaerolineae bacterium]|nr:penicillin-binding protein 2 [Anaerolineae bacterium]
MINDDILSRRLTMISMLLIAVAAVLILNLLRFQFYMDPEVKAALAEGADSRLHQTVEVQPDRGLIFDRNGHLLARNSFDYRIGISPNVINNPQQVALELAPYVGLTEDELYRVLHRPDPNDFEELSKYELLAARVDFETGQQIVALEIPGIQIEAIPTRIYPQGNLTAQLVGFFAGADDTRTSRGYYGVEGYYQPLLAGQPRRVTTSTAPSINDAQVTMQVRDGIDLVLTIDRDLQFLAQDVLNAAVADQDASGGTILIMNPRNGEILAMANSPTFDLNLLTDPDNILLASNPAVSAIYEPGSVFKVITMALALDLGTHDLDWSYYDPGCFEGGGHNICNWDLVSHGNPDFSQVFIESLNTGTATIFREIGPYAVYPKLREFGIGTPTGVDLEGESPGILREPGDPLWSDSSFLTTSFGQGVSVTVLQMLTAVNAVANEGLIMQPHIVLAQIEGGEVLETRPSASHRPISANAARTACGIMVRVVEESAEIVFDLPGYTVAGKTGTAEIPTPYGYEDYGPHNSITTFVAFLPADDPVVSILVKLDRPAGYWGSKTAAPVTQTLLERLVVLMEIPPDHIRAELEAAGGAPFLREYQGDNQRTGQRAGQSTCLFAPQ